MHASISDWLRSYLNRLRRDDALLFAQETATLPLVQLERSTADPARPVSIHEAITAAPIALVGPAGAGKTTLLRQLAAEAAHTALIAFRKGQLRDGSSPVPILIDLGRFRTSLDATIADLLGGDTPPLTALAEATELLILLDGLDRLAPRDQLAALASIGQSLTTLGTHVQWAATCRTAALPLFRPWLNTAQIFQIEPLSPADVHAAVAQRTSADAAAWLADQHDLTQLARRPRWLAALTHAGVLDRPPYARGPLLSALLATVLGETASSSALIAETMTALPALAAALDQAGQSPLTADRAVAHLAAQSTVGNAQATLQLLTEVGIVLDDQLPAGVRFALPLLHDIARAIGLTHTPPSGWPDAVLTRPWREALVLTYGLQHEREMTLSWLLEHDATEIAARCLIETSAPDQIEPLLQKTGRITASRRIRLADSLSALGSQSAAIAQLEQAAREGAQDVAIFRRLGDLYTAAGQWRHARLAYIQVLAREPEDLWVRQKLGSACSRIGELAEAEAALQHVIGAVRQIHGEAAAELGQIFVAQGRLEPALAAFQQAVAAQPGTPAYHRGMATTLHRLGRTGAAEHILRDLLATRNDDAEAHAELGRIYADTGRPHEAVAAFVRAAALQPHIARHYTEVGRLRMLAGDPVGARAALQRAAQLAESDPALQLALGETAEACGDSGAALEAYRRAIQLDPHNGQALLRLGMLLGALGQHDEGIEMLRRAIDLQPGTSDGYAALGQLQRQRGESEQALVAFRQAQALAPHSADYELAIGLTLRDLGRTQESARHLTHALELAPERADLHAAIGAYAASHDDWAAAAASYQQATALDQTTASFPRAAAEAQLQLGQPQAARDLLAEALRRNRRDQASWLAAGRLYISSQRWRPAIRALKRAGQQRPVYEQLGRAFYALGHHDEAITAFAQALLAGANTVETFSLYSRVLAEAGQISRAYDIARRALESAGGQPELLQHAGMLARRLGRPHEALALLDQALSIDPLAAAAHAERGRVLLEQRQPLAALESARAALAATPDLPEAILTSGLALADLGRRDEAREQIERALTLRPADAETFAARRDLLVFSDPNTAIESGRKAVALAPEQLDHRLRLGALQLEYGEPHQAIATLEQALTLDPHAPSAHAWLSRAFAKAGSWAQAHRSAEQAIELQPADSELPPLLAEALAGAGDTASAIELLDTAVGQHGERAALLLTRGKLRLSTGDPAGLADLQAAVTADPQRAEAFHALGMALVEQGDLIDAIPALESAVRLAPERAAWRTDLAELQLTRGWTAEALAEIEQALMVAQHDMRALRVRATIRLKLGRSDEAQSDLVAVLRRNPDDLASLTLYARTMFERGQLNAACGAARRAATLRPDDLNYRRMLAEILRALGQHAEAADQTEHIAAHTTVAADWTQLAVDRMAAGQAELAERAWERAVRAEPADAALRVEYGAFLMRNGNPAHAHTQLHQAIRLAPDLAEAHARIAELRVLAETGAGYEPAIESARRATTLDPTHPDAWAALGAALHAAQIPIEALDALREATRLAPQRAELAAQNGLVALEQGAYPEAIEAFTTALQRRPAAAYAAGLAMALRGPLGQPVLPEEIDDRLKTDTATIAQAATVITHAVEHEPGVGRWRYEQAIIAQLGGQHAAALDALTLASQSGPPSDTPPRSLADRTVAILSRAIEPQELQLRVAVSQYALGRIDEAIQTLDTILATDPEQHQAAQLRGVIAGQRGEASLAQRLLGQVIAQGSAGWRILAALGRALLGAERAQEAIGHVERAVEMRQDDASMAALLADVYAAAGRRERAITTAVKAARLDPRTAEHHHRLATLYAQSGRLQDARAALMSALSLRPDRSEWHVQMAQICTGLGMRDAARTSIKRAIEIAPEEPAHRYELARQLADQGEEQEARATLEQVVARAPERGEWRYELARLYDHLGDRAGALREFQAAVQYAPDEPNHWRGLAAIQQVLAGDEAAIETIERALIRFAQDHNLHTAVGALYEARGARDLAAWHYRRAVESDASRAEPWWRLGALLLEQSDRQEALNAVEQALSLDPRAAPAHAIKAKILAADGDAQSALYHGRTAAALNPGDTSALSWVANALMQLNRADEAYQLLARAIDRRSENVELLSLLGDTALGSGRDESASNIFERAIDLRPDDATLQYRAGLAHRRLKQWRAAIHRLRRAIKLRPDYGDAIRELSTLGPLAFFTNYADPTATDDEEAVDNYPPYERPDRRS